MTSSESPPVRFRKPSQRPGLTTETGSDAPQPLASQPSTANSRFTGALGHGINLISAKAESESPPVRFRKPLQRPGLTTETGSDAPQPPMSHHAANSIVTGAPPSIHVLASLAAAMHPPSDETRYHRVPEMETVKIRCNEVAASSCSSEEYSSDLIVEDEDAVASPGVHGAMCPSPISFRPSPLSCRSSLHWC